MNHKKNPHRCKADKSPRKAVKSPRYAGAGRPTKYQPAYAEQARKLALLGMSDKEMGNFFGVTEQTVNNWKHAHPEFFESLKAGKEGADVDVSASLYRAAIGGGTITELKEETDAEGNVITRKTVKELPANVTAQIFWLKNRQPQKWREKVVIEDETPVDITRSADVFVKIMAAARERQQQILIERGLTSLTTPEDGS